MAKLKVFTVKPKIPDGLDGLLRLAYNYHWAWSLDTYQLFQRVDSRLWDECNHNPVRLLNTVPSERLEELNRDRGFMEHYNRALKEFEDYLKQVSWYSENIKPLHKELVIAYFCAEYGIHKSMPMYSGGLGVLAGDHLKSASDLGIPLVAIGLLYKYGYFRQQLDASGWQREEYPITPFELLPILPQLDETGKEIKVSIEMPNGNVMAKVWRLEVGRVKLFLLDTDLEENSPEDRSITDKLYGGDNEHRIRQEIVLGIGGVRALEAMKIQPTIYHMNEGHAAFLTLERIRRLIKRFGFSFDEALMAMVANNVFTTHTPVPAGHDVFPPELAAKYLSAIAKSIGVDTEQLLRLGRSEQNNRMEKFSMTTLAVRCSNYINGVSKLHGLVSKKILAHLFDGLPNLEVPVDAVTNGVHPQSWVSLEMKMLFDRYLGSDWRERPSDPKVWEPISSISDETLWAAKERGRESFVAWVREQVAKQLEQRGATPAQKQRARQILHREALTIGFARRFATYKRAGLLFNDLDRLRKILTNKKYPVQIIFAGKAHPKDEGGKEIIKKIIQFSQEPELRPHIAFLENYDITIAKKLVRGVDVWLNTPIRGLEASGTSGMKVLFNGGLNLSVLDGWWDEAYQDGVGWAIKPADGEMDAEYRDHLEASMLYDILENEVIPLFYKRDSDGLPRQWIDMMKKSMVTLCPIFSSHRMLVEYLERAYIPASDEWVEMTRGEGEKLKGLIYRASLINKGWNNVTFESASATPVGELLSGEKLLVNATLNLGDINPSYIRAEIFFAKLGAEQEILDVCSIELELRESNAAGKCVIEEKVEIPWSGKIGIALRIQPKIADLMRRLELERTKWCDAL
ncbi:MAG: glycosyltransferase family 1 protein [Myxococcota bacterium]